MGNLYLPEEINFLPQAAIEHGKSDTGFNLAVAALVLLVAAACFWGFTLYTSKRQKVAEYNTQANNLRKLQAEAQKLQTDVNRLKPFEGWKQYLESIQNRQPWNMVFSELAMIVPENMLIRDIQMEAKDSSAVSGTIKGSIRAADWEEGLEIVRMVGERLQASPMFHVTNVQYTPEGPEGLERMQKDFEFSMNLTLQPRGKVNES